MGKLYVVVVDTKYHGLAVEMITTDFKKAEEKVSYYEGEAEMYEFDIEEGKELTIVENNGELKEII